MCTFEEERLVDEKGWQGSDHIQVVRGLCLCEMRKLLKLYILEQHVISVLNRSVATV